MSTAVLGAGISGLSIASILQDRGEQTVVFEKNSTCGGLARTRFVNGYLYDPHGGHILNSKHSEVMEWAFSIYPKEKWKFTARNAKIYMNGTFISYPFELSLGELNTESAVDCAHDFLLSGTGPEPDNFKDWLIWNFGQAISDQYMIPYNQKIWAYPLEDMETRWMQGKMPLPTKKEIIRSLLLKDSSERKMPHSTFYYPLSGGIQSFCDAMARTLDIRYGEEVTAIEYVKGRWKINRFDGFDRVISTIPLPMFKGVMTLPEKVKTSLSGLKYNSLTTVLYRCPKTDITWLYIPGHNYKSHRVGYQSALTPNASPAGNEGVAALEMIGEKFDVNDLVNRRDILPEELGYRETMDSEFTEYAYVIHDREYRNNLKLIHGYFDSLPNFELLGRWGRWNYNNMDICIYDAMQLAGNL